MKLKFRVWLDYNNSFEYPKSIMLHNDGTVETDRSRGGIVQQFTGLSDKNGKEIYEGDILKEDTGLTTKVYFENGSYIRSSSYYEDWCYLGVWHKQYEVVGNIFENPELLMK